MCYFRVNINLNAKEVLMKKKRDLPTFTYSHLCPLRVFDLSESPVYASNALNVDSP